MNNLQQLIQMGQQLQAKVAEIQERLDAQEVASSAGGGMVKATVDGKGTLKGLRIDPAVVDPEDLVAEASTRAIWAYQTDVGQKLHLDGFESLASTRFTPASLDIEREIRCCELCGSGGGLRGKQGSDLIPGFRVGGGVAT